VFGTQTFAVLGEEGSLEAVDDRSEPDHVSAPH
jgi:hypothetical protein